MIVVDPGHEYLLNSLDGEQQCRLVFVKREGEKYPGNVGHHPGTTMQEVLRALIDRACYVNRQIPCQQTEEAVRLMKEVVRLFEERAALRHGREPPWTDQAVYGATCRKCGHVGCGGKCHP